jgi:hypothetical protein
MQAYVHASPTGISLTTLRRRDIAAEQVRRVHLYTDANGEQGIVVRNSLFRFVYIPSDRLTDPQVVAGVRSLVDRVRGRAQVDQQVDTLLRSVA